MNSWTSSTSIVAQNDSRWLLTTGEDTRYPEPIQSFRIQKRLKYCRICPYTINYLLSIFLSINYLRVISKLTKYWYKSWSKLEETHVQRALNSTLLKLFNKFEWDLRILCFIKSLNLYEYLDNAGFTISKIYIIELMCTHQQMLYG